MIGLREGESVLKRPSRLFGAAHRKQNIAKDGMSFRGSRCETDGRVSLCQSLIPLFPARKLMRVVHVRKSREERNVELAVKDQDAVGDESVGAAMKKLFVRVQVAGAPIIPVGLGAADQCGAFNAGGDKRQIPAEHMR